MNIYNNIANSKTKILFECKPEHNKYTLISKTKEFLLSEINTFKNELVHFFNIYSMSSTLYIYLEIEGKKYKSNNSQPNYYKLILYDIGIIEKKKEIICTIVDNVELKFLIRNINKYARKKSNTIHKKDSNLIGMKGRGRLFTQNTVSIFKNQKISPSIKEKIKIFSGEFIKRQIYEDNKVIPGKLKIPTLFQNDISKKEDDKNDIKKNGIKEKNSKENIINDGNNKNE